jgi:hypothetical protein
MDSYREDSNSRTNLLQATVDKLSASIQVLEPLRGRTKSVEQQLKLEKLLFDAGVCIRKSERMKHDYVDGMSIVEVM